MSDMPSTFVKGFHDEATVRRMVYNKLGKTNLMVSKLSLGGAAFSPFYGDVKEERAIKIIQKAIRSGINYIDTAPYYGNRCSEKIIGKALEGIPRKAYYIATKVARYGGPPAEQFDFSAKRTKESIDMSLKYLGLDYVDIIQIHDVEFAENLDIVINETLPAVEEARAEGKAKFIGVTGYPLHVLKEAILKAPARFDTVLAYARYTMLDDSLLEYLPFFLEQNLGVICASDLALGLLTNRGPFDWHMAHAETLECGRLCAAYCEKNGVELGEIAQWYSIQLKGPATFLTGMATEDILDINLKVIFDGLTSMETDVLNYCLENFCARKSHWEGIELRKNFNR